MTLLTTRRIPSQRETRLLSFFMVLSLLKKCSGEDRTVVLGYSCEVKPQHQGLRQAPYLHITSSIRRYLPYDHLCRLSIDMLQYVDRLMHAGRILLDHSLPPGISHIYSYSLTIHPLNSLLLCLHSSLHTILSLPKRSL